MVLPLALFSKAYAVEENSIDAVLRATQHFCADKQYQLVPNVSEHSIKCALERQPPVIEKPALNTLASITQKIED